MDKSSNQEAPTTPDLKEATREGYLADIETMPMRLTAEAAYKSGTKLYSTPDGRYFTGEQVDKARDGSKEYVDSLLSQVPESWQKELKAQIKEFGLSETIRRNDQWIQQAAAGEADAQGLTPDQMAAYRSWAAAEMAPERSLPAGSTLVADFTGMGEQATIDRNVASQTKLMEAGAELSQQMERDRLKAELELLPQYNALNLDQQKATFDAALEAGKKSTAAEYDLNLQYGDKFNAQSLAQQQAAWEQSQKDGIAGTRAMNDLQTELLPGINDLGRSEQQKASDQYLYNQQQAWDLSNTLLRQQASNGAEYGLALAKNQQKTQRDAFDQNLNNATDATAAQSAQAAQLQASLLPQLNDASLGMQGQANAASRTDSRAAVDDMATMLPGLNALGINMQGQANAASRADAMTAAQQAAGLTQQFNGLQRADQGADFQQNLGQNMQSVAALSAMQPQVNAQTQALTMGNQAQANAASMQDSLRAAGITADMAAQLMPQFAAMSQSAQRDAAAGAYAMQDQYLPGLNQQNLAMQGQARQAALQSLQQTDPTGYANREALGQQVMADVALGDSLSPAQQRRMEQQMREAQASRGNILGDAPMVDEVMAVTGYGDQLKQQRQGAAMNFLNSKDLLPQFQATQGQNFAGQLNLGNNIESGAQAALAQFKPQTGYQAAAVADPLAAFNVDANTAQSNGYGDALSRYNPQTGYEAMSGNTAAGLYNPQTGYQSMQVNNPLTQTAVNANASTGYEFTNPFNTQNSQMNTAGVQTQTAVNPLMPNFSSTGQVSMNTPNFQATQTSGPNLSPTSISSGLSGIWNQNSGTQGQGFAQQNFQNQNSMYQAQQDRKSQQLAGLMQLGGTIAGAAI